LIKSFRFEPLFFSVLEDLKYYLNDLTLVGGWIPYIYTRFLWNNVHAKLVTTIDIDFGFGEVKESGHRKTIFESLSALDYTERHLDIDKIYPVVLYKGGKVPIDFITFSKMADDVAERFVGKQIHINKIDKFDFLLRYRILVNVNSKKHKGTYKIYCPKPSAFLYQKAATFIDREYEQKLAKDLHYIYFILRYAPDIKSIFKEIIQYKKKDYFKGISRNLREYFERKSSEGCLLVEKENGPDEYIDDLRQDIFERFSRLRELF